MSQTKAVQPGPRRSAPGGPAVGGGVPVIPERRRSVAPGLLMTVAVIMAGARIGVLTWQPDRPQQVVDVLETVRGHTGWLVPVAAMMAGLAAVGWLVRFTRHRHDADRQRVIAAAASALRTPPASVVLRGARWDHGSLLRGRLYYPRGAVLADCSEPLTATLTPFAAGPLRARWERRADHFVLDLMPPRPQRIEESSDEVRQVFVPLDHMLTGLCIDQARTRLMKDGQQLEQIVATYSTTTRDIGDGFRQRVPGMEAGEKSGDHQAQYTAAIQRALSDMERPGGTTAYPGRPVGGWCDPVLGRFGRTAHVGDRPHRYGQDNLHQLGAGWMSLAWLAGVHRRSQGAFVPGVRDRHVGRSGSARVARRGHSGHDRPRDGAGDRGGLRGDAPSVLLGEDLRGR